MGAIGSAPTEFPLHYHVNRGSTKAQTLKNCLDDCKFSVLSSTAHILIELTDEHTYLSREKGKISIEVDNFQEEQLQQCNPK